MSNQVDEMARQEAEQHKEKVAAEIAAALNPDAPGEITYVVQIGRDFEGITHQGPIWEDIATVKVAPRTKRSTVIKQALSDAGIRPDAKGTKARLRALDIDSAEVHEPEAVQPEPEWRL